MKTSANGRQFIEQFEGCRLTAYQDSGGVWTIGYGHIGWVHGAPLKSGVTITASEADQLFAEEIGGYEQGVLSRIQFTPTQHEFDALVSMAYNCGAGAITKTADKYALINNNLYYIHAGGNVIKGLQRRRIAEARLFFTGNYSTAIADADYYDFYTGIGTGTVRDMQIKTIYNNEEDKPMTDAEKKEFNAAMKRISDLETALEKITNTISGSDTVSNTFLREGSFEWAKENGVTDGNKPTALITREQATSMIFRAVNNKSVTESDWAKKDKSWEKAKKAGITDGTRPKALTTREQTAAMILRAMKEDEQ